MSESPNPYVAPVAHAEPNPALPAWTAPILRAALVVIMLDFARGAAWRLFTALATFGPFGGAFGDHFNPNVVIQLAAAVAMVFAVTSLARRHDGAVVAAPVLRIACIATAIAAISMYVTRLVVDAVAGTMAGVNLGVASFALDSTAVVFAALYLAAVFSTLGAEETGRRVKLLAAVYTVATALAMLVVASNAREHGFLPPGTGSSIRSVTTLVFIALGIVGYRVVRAPVRG